MTVALILAFWLLVAALFWLLIGPMTNYEREQKAERWLDEKVAANQLYPPSRRGVMGVPQRSPIDRRAA